HDARVAVQVGTSDHIGVVVGVDAGGVGLQAQVAASVIHEQRRVGDVADTGVWHGRRTAVIKRAGRVIVAPIHGVRVEIDDAVVQRAGPVPAAVGVSRVAGQRAVVQ